MPNLTPFIIAGLSTGAVYVLAGVGLVVLYRASGVLNFAQGAIGALGALLAWSIADAGWPQAIGWGAGIASSIALSLCYGRLIAPRLAHSDPIVRAVATLGFALIVLGFVEFIWGETPRSLRLPTDTMGFMLFGVRITYTRALAFLLSLLITAAVGLFLGRTRLGLSMRALADDRDISGLIGVRVLRADAWAWALSGAIAGISGLMLGNLVRLQALSLTFIVIPAMAAVIAGRLRSLPATVFSGLAIGVIEAMGTPFYGLAPFRSAAPFVFAVIALLWLQRHQRSLFSAGGDGGRGMTPVAGGRPVWQQLAGGAVFALLAALLLPWLASAYWLKTLTSVAAMILASLSVALLYAQLGMVSLAQYALVAVGGWFTLRIWHGTGAPFELALLGGGVAAAVGGVLVSLPALRMRGLYLALVTLMIAGAVQIIVNAIGFPDGGPGVTGRVTVGARAFMQRPWLAQSDAAYFRYVLVFVVGGFLLVRWHRRSRAGRAWAQIRRSEVCALSAGVNIVAYKVWAFALAGFLAGVAGGLAAGSVGQLDGRAFPASDSIMLFALTVIAGAFHWLGPVIAGLLLRAVPALLTDWNVDGNLATMVFGAGLLHALITSPAGASGQLTALGRRLAAWLRSRLTPASAPAVDPRGVADLGGPASNQRGAS